MSTTPLTRRSLLRAAGLLAGGAGAATLLTACGVDEPAAAGGGGTRGAKVQPRSPGTAGAIRDSVAEQFGLEAKHGLRLDRKAGGGPGAGQEQLLTGVLDIYAFGPLGATEVNTSGHDVVIVGPSLWNHGRWIVPADSPYQSIADLKGRKVGVQPPSSDTYRAAALASAVNGIRFDREFKLFTGQPIANLALYERGDLDAIIAIEPNATRLVAAGNRQLASVGELWQKGTGDSSPLFLNGTAVRRDWLAANRETAKAYVDFTLEAWRLIKQDPALIGKYHADYGVPAGEKKAIELLPGRLAPVYADGWDDTVFANLEKQIDLAIEVGVLKKRADKPVYEKL
ncbi:MULTISPECIES: ABC transporter substrate-binding protein [unclassified Micromonospora]|uniref:ABC transporter substrate-binding protein n=1 Tax=Micromonospora TaxID=1873 RepID=UPI0024167451|nr:MULTISPECIES: ABC transporter substrate-binding protein [unclassified Micromonospora]MDG4819957.1 ABC transporter substrate-binding protein [Micromonospora sp. WMMD956]WFE56370.1 ABC transporter substrate-binding protein [Micromonospora sp. WMMD712]